MEGVDEQVIQIAVPDEKVPGHSDTDQRDSEPFPYLHIEQRQADGDSRSSAQHLAQEAVTGVVVVLAVSTEPDLVKEELAKNVGGVERVSIAAK